MTTLQLCFTWKPITLFSSVKAIMDQLPFSPWFLIIPIIGVGVIYLIFRIRKQKEEYPIESESPEPVPNNMEIIEMERYAGGHPLLNDAIQPCILCIQSSVLHLCSYTGESKGTITSLMEIPVDDIIELRIEDSFTMMKKMTSERWKQVSKHFHGLENRRDEDVAFLVVEWQYELSTQQTYFAIESVGNAMEVALRKRNALMKFMRTQNVQAEMALL